MLFGIRTLTLLCVTSLTFCDLIKFSINYFKEKHVNFVCLLTCRRDAWFHHNLAKYASKHNIAVSSFNINQRFNSKYLTLCMKETGMSTGVLVNPKCPSFEKVMHYASENFLLDSKHKWFIIEEGSKFKNPHISYNAKEALFGNCDNNEDFAMDMEIQSAEVLNKLNLSVDADITVSVKRNNVSYALYEVYNFGKMRNGKFVINYIGEWNVVKGLNIAKEFKYYRRWDFHQMQIKSVIVMTPIPPVFDPQMVLGPVPDYRAAKITHTGAMILHEITGIHNFRFNYTVLDRWIGDYVKEHKAVTNALYFREQDITPVLRFIPHHFDKYDVTAPAVSYIETRFYYRIPSQGIGKFENQFLRPLSTNTWLCVIAICVLCCVVLLLSAIVENCPINIYYSFFSILALVCQQFFEELEDIRRISEARKMTILVTGLSCLLIYNYYTSSVVSWLLNGPPPSINSLWELIDGALEPIFEDVGYTYSWLQLPDYYFNRKAMDAEDELKRLVKKSKTVVASINEGIELVRKGGYAYHAETNSANARISQTFNQRELCDLDSLHSMDHDLLYSGVPKNSPYREFFSWSLARLQERGVINRIHEKTWAREMKCAGSSPRALALGGAAPAFILLAGGIILGILIMLMERLWWKLFNDKNKTRL